MITLGQAEGAVFFGLLIYIYFLETKYRKAKRDLIVFKYQDEKQDAEIKADKDSADVVADRISQRLKSGDDGSN